MFIRSYEGGNDHHIQIHITPADEIDQTLDLSTSEEQYAQKILQKEDHVFLFRQKTPLILLKAPENSGKSADDAELLRRRANAILPLLWREGAEAALLSGPAEAAIIAAAEGLALGNYQFLKYYGDRDKRVHALKELQCKDVSEQAKSELQAQIDGVYLARDLVNEPLSYLTAPQLALEAEKAGERFGFRTEILNKKKLESLKMGGLLAVNKGSIDPPTFTIMEYKPEGAKNEKPLVLVGKGVVYDTGGLSLKPTANSMDSMKSDMGGAAAVIGAISAAAAAKLPLHVIALVPATDNRPGLNAYAPGDVVKMYDGTTVEVLNTDAEGRMLLADALAYAKKYEPELVFDLATLTGAAAMAIGKYGVVAMGTAEERYQELLNAGESSHERVALMPFWPEYADLLKSDIADLKNIGGRVAGAITAGKFLQHFTDYPWLHIDIAGPAFLDGADHYRTKGGSGVGVRLLYQFLKNRADVG